MQKKYVCLTNGIIVLTPQFARDTPTGSQESSDDQARARALGLLRTINTAGVGEFETYASYSSWETLLTHQSKSKHWIEECLASLCPKELGQHPELSEAQPKTLPGWTLRLNARADGQGYDAMLEEPEAKHESFVPGALKVEKEKNNAISYRTSTVLVHPR